MFLQYSQLYVYKFGILQPLRAQLCNLLALLCNLCMHVPICLYTEVLNYKITVLNINSYFAVFYCDVFIKAFRSRLVYYIHIV